MDNNLTFWGNGTQADIKLSMEDYFELVDVLNDERLSNEAQMKFKNLHEVNVYGCAFVPIYCLPIGLGMALLATGRSRRSHSGYRYLWPTLSITWPLACWFGFTRPIPRRLYTEILCDNGDDGSYVRQRLCHRKPGLWRKFSQQLTQKGYRFPEQIENLDTVEFPLDFVNRT